MFQKYGNELKPHSEIAHTDPQILRRLQACGVQTMSKLTTESNVHVGAYMLAANPFCGELYKPPAERKECVGFETSHGSSTQRIGDRSRPLASADVAVLQASSRLVLV